MASKGGDMVNNILHKEGREAWHMSCMREEHTLLVSIRSVLGPISIRSVLGPKCSGEGVSACSKKHR